MLLTLNDGSHEKFPIHSKSFVAKTKLSNRLKPPVLRYFKCIPNAVVSQQHRLCQHFCVIRSKKPASRVSVNVLKHNSYSNRGFCSGGTSKKPLSLTKDGQNSLFIAYPKCFVMIARKERIFVNFCSFLETVVALQSK